MKTKVITRKIHNAKTLQDARAISKAFVSTFREGEAQCVGVFKVTSDGPWEATYIVPEEYTECY